MIWSRTESQSIEDYLLDVRLRVVQNLLTPVVTMSTWGLVGGRPPAPVSNVLKKNLNPHLCLKSHLV